MLNPFLDLFIRGAEKARRDDNQVSNDAERARFLYDRMISFQQAQDSKIESAAPINEINDAADQHVLYRTALMNLCKRYGVSPDEIRNLGQARI